MPLLKNELHDYATHNYIWTLSAMYPGEINNPSSYKGSTGKLPIVGQGGLGNSKTVTTDDENNIGVNVESYIDNINIEQNFNSTPEHPTFDVASFSFEVVEPYSLGLFIQTMRVAAGKAGWANFNHAPYLLSCTFKGQKQDGTMHTLSVRNFVVSITSISMNSNASGSTYEVTAIPWNFRAMMDSVTTLPEDVRLEGSTVAEILATGEKSLAAYLNTRQLKLQAQQRRTVPDVYQIDFPLDIGFNAASGTGIGNFFQQIQGGLNKINNAVSAISSVGTALNNFGQALSNIGSISIGFDAGQVDPRLASAAGFAPDGRPVLSEFQSLGASISNFGQSISVAGINISNEIGNSPMIESFNDFGDAPFGNEDATWDPEKRIFRRGNLEVSGERRVYTFKAGTRIDDVIENIILLSQWGQTRATAAVTFPGYFLWFKIVPKQEIISTIDTRVGKVAVRNLYQVIPYFKDDSRISPLNSTGNYGDLVDSCVKAYDYTYTGLNRDIVDFEVTFNNLFTTMQTADNLQFALHDITSFGGSAVAQKNQRFSEAQEEIELAQNVTKFTQSVGNLVNLWRAAGGTFDETNPVKTAYSFRQALIQDGGLINLNLEIWGDPYFLTDSAMGNYIASANGFNINNDLTIDTVRSDCFVLVRFNNAVDYQGNLLSPNDKGLVSGVYRVESVYHTFNAGRFTSSLQLTRKENTNSSTLAKVDRILNAFFGAAEAVADFAGLVGATEVANNVNNFISEVTPAANSLRALAAIGDNIDTIVNNEYGTIQDKLAGLDALFGQVGLLSNQISQLSRSFENIDLNRLTPTTSPRPRARPTTSNTTPTSVNDGGPGFR